jgi:hypothetical protein
MKLLLLLLTFTLPLLGATRLSLSDQIIEPDTKIELIFDKAMVAPDAVGKTIENSILTIKPAWKTKLNWRSQNIATIVSIHAPKVATKYEFSLSKDLKAIDGTVVPAQKFNSAQSEPFQIVRSLRNGSVRTGNSVLMFNDHVSPTTAAPFFQFVSPKTEDQSEQIVAALTRKATWGDLRSRYYYQPSWQERFAAKNRRYGSPAPDPTEVIKHALVVEPVTPPSHWQALVASSSFLPPKCRRHRIHKRHQSLRAWKRHSFYHQARGSRDHPRSTPHRSDHL